MFYNQGMAERKAGVFYAFRTRKEEKKGKILAEREAYLDGKKTLKRTKGEKRAALDTNLNIKL
ncbi:MAG TPA: hypothetical protein VIG80_08440 [Bacillaceae bacterium]